MKFVDHAGDFAFAVPWVFGRCYPREYKNACVNGPSALGNTRRINKLTKVSRVFQVFIHTTKRTNFCHNNISLE